LRVTELRAPLPFMSWRAVSTRPRNIFTVT